MFAIRAAIVWGLLTLIMGITANSASASILTSGGTPNGTNTDMLLWLRADQGFTSGATTTWTSQAPGGYTFSQTNASYSPTLNPTGLNGQATIDFDGNDFLRWANNTITGHQTAFIVYSDQSTNQWATPLGTTYITGVGSSYHGHNSSAQLFTLATSPGFSNPHTDGKTLNGLNLRNGQDIERGLSTGRPGESFVIQAHVATGPLTQFINTIGADNGSGGMNQQDRAINGGIAEILVFNRALDKYELDDVGNYLQGRYGITWNDLTYGRNTIALSAVVAGGDGTDRINVFGGINQLTGELVTSNTLHVNSSAGFQAVAALAYVDGVSVPNGGAGGGPVVYNTLGQTILLPETTGTSYGYIGNQPASATSSVLAGVNYLADGNSMLQLHASGLITFDLAAMEADHNGQQINRFTATVGAPDTNQAGSVEYRVYLDGVLVDSQLITNALRGQAFDVDVAIGVDHRFLTLVTLDHGNRGSDSIIWGNAQLSLVPEPSTYALGLFGAATVVVLLRRRTRR